MSNKLFKSIFAVAMVLGAAFGFASCTPQDEPAATDPKVEVSKTALTFSKAEGSDTLDVTATAGWKTEVAVDWVTVAPATGNGNKTITVSVSANDTGAKRETVLKVHAIHPEYGNWDTKKVTIIQSANEDVAVEEVVLYSDDFDGKEATKTYGDKQNSWPYIDQFLEFVNKKGDAAANVTYSGSGVSVRANSTSNSDYSDYAGSGSNNIFFGGGAYFQVNNIAPLEGLNYKITFGTEKYAQEGDSTFRNEELIVSLSKDGEKWAPIEYTYAGVEPGRWNVATANFTLAAATEKLYIKFEAKVASVYRIDDLKFSIGNGGQTIDLDNIAEPEPAETITIAEALAVGQGNTINGAIEGIVISNMDLNNLTSKRGMYVQDETGALQFYLGDNHTFAFGTKVRIDLTNATLGSYNGAVQVSGIGLNKITTISTGNTVEPKSVTMADYLANKYEGQYIALDGVQVIPSDLTKTWGSDTDHTSIYMEDAEGNQFVVFSSKYATYRGETVAQGSGTLKGISSINEGKMQIIFAQATDYAGLTGERFTSVSPEPEPEPEPTPAPVTPGAFTSDAAFVCSADDSTNAAYTLGASTIDNEPVSGFKLGKSKQAGKFTSAAVGVSGNKYLNFYAVGWKGGDVTLYYRVDGGATMSQKLDSNSTATGNPPYTGATALSLFVTDHYSVLLEGLTETSTIEFSTDANFALTTSESTMASARAIVCGVKLTDEPIDVENPGTGEEPENPGTGEEPENPGTGEEPENPVDPELPTESLEALTNDAYYIFKPATEINGGKWYAIVSENHAATALTKNYGYLSVVDGIERTNGIALPASCAFGFLTTTNGYTIQQYDNKYVYQTGTYDSFNVSDTLPADGGVWTVAVDGDKFTITNNSVNKFVQYDTKYGSYGSYSDARGNVPTLYELVEIDNSAMIVSVSSDSLLFAANGGTDAVEVVTYGDATLAATSNVDWVTASVSGNVVNVTVDANDVAEAREATITITYGEASKAIAVSQAAAGDVNEFVITFPGTPSSYTNAYTKAFTMTLDNAYEFEFANINNGQETNAWTEVRFGRKSDASVATIVTKTAVPYAVSSVKINFTQVDTEMNSAKLIVAKDNAFSDIVEEVTATLAVGEVVYPVKNPAENLYYKLEYDMPSTGANGSYRFDKLTYAK